MPIGKGDCVLGRSWGIVCGGLSFDVWGSFEVGMMNGGRGYEGLCFRQVMGLEDEND